MARMEKRSIETTPVDEELRSRPGFGGLNIWWVISRLETATDGILVNIADFPPQRAHEVHRHDGAHEVLFVISGSGQLTHDGAPVPISAGEVVIHPAGEWHGFYNDTDEVTRVLSVWAGVSAYDELTYEALEGWQEILRSHGVDLVGDPGSAR